MKRILAIITVMILASCTTHNPAETIKGSPEQETTVEILNNADTAVISIVGSEVYLLKDGKVYGKAIMSKPETTAVHDWIIGVVLSLNIIVIGFIVGAAIIK